MFWLPCAIEAFPIIGDAIEVFRLLWWICHETNKIKYLYIFKKMYIEMYIRNVIFKYIIKIVGF